MLREKLVNHMEKNEAMFSSLSLYTTINKMEYKHRLLLHSEFEDFNMQAEHIFINTLVICPQDLAYQSK